MLPASVHDNQRSLVSFQVSEPLASTSLSNINSSQKTSKGPNIFSPELIRPLPKAAQRKTSPKGRKKRQSAVLTDTPDKDALEKEQTSQKLKKSKEIIKPKVKKRKKKVFVDSSSEEECFCLVCGDEFSNSKPK